MEQVRASFNIGLIFPRPSHPAVVNVGFALHALVAFLMASFAFFS